ncbi:MAG: hypothetical protein ACPGOY_18730 [Rhodospirillaceae bacterium]
MINDDTEAWDEGETSGGSTEASPPDATPEILGDAQDPDSLSDASVQPKDTEAGPDPAEDAPDNDAEDEDGSDTLEIDLGGSKHRIDRAGMSDEAVEKVQSFAKSLHADYTEKTQGASEQRSVASVEQDRLNHFMTLTGAQMAATIESQSLNTSLELMQARLTEDLWQFDPENARLLSDMIRGTQAQLQRRSTEVQQIQQSSQAEFAAAQQANWQRGVSYVTQRIKDFDETALIKFVMDNGVPEHSARAWPMSPEVTVLMHDAMKYRAMQAKTRKPTKSGLKSAKPVKALKGRGASRTMDPGSPASDKLPIEQWMKLRNKAVHGSG